MRSIWNFVSYLKEESSRTRRVFEFIISTIFRQKWGLGLLYCSYFSLLTHCGLFIWREWFRLQHRSGFCKIYCLQNRVPWAPLDTRVCNFMISDWGYGKHAWEWSALSRRSTEKSADTLYANTSTQQLRVGRSKTTKH